MKFLDHLTYVDRGLIREGAFVESVEGGTGYVLCVIDKRKECRFHVLCGLVEASCSDVPALLQVLGTTSESLVDQGTFPVTVR